jgi:hypothetical protein
MRWARVRSREWVEANDVDRRQQDNLGDDQPEQVSTQIGTEGELAPGFHRVDLDLAAVPALEIV